MTVLSVPVFGGGVVLEGSPGTRQVNELSAIDNLDITPRGQLIMPSDVTDFVTPKTSALGTDIDLVFDLFAAGNPILGTIVAVGDALGFTYIAYVKPDGTIIGGSATAWAIPMSSMGGACVTWAAFPYSDASGNSIQLVMVNIAPREWLPPSVSGRGLLVLRHDVVADTYAMNPIVDFDFLGTGPGGEFPGGSHSEPAFFRGIVAYNSHLFGWGFDRTVTNGFYDGPNRLMFSNIGNPLKWGNDPQAQAIADGGAETDRFFEDSDAIVIGGAGEVIRDCYVYNGRLWVGTNEQLHYVEGFGRESFKTNGAIPIRRSRNVIGPHAMIEGPDSLLYGVSDEGLWRTAGAEVEPIGDRLYDFNGRSPGYWDLIWSDPTQAPESLPGLTNQDLVWMRSETSENTQRVWVVIPYCDANAGFGKGPDTVVVKFNTATGGFSRQVFFGEILLAGSSLKRQGTATAEDYVAVVGDGTSIQRYAYKATVDAAPALPPSNPLFRLGEYAPFGPDGVGVMRKKYLSLAWAQGALPLVFTLTLTVDGQALAPLTLFIQPTMPVSATTGDIWVDTSGTDTNLGNGTAGTIVRANAGDYQLRTWVGTWNKWVKIPGGGQQGNRVTVPIAFPSVRGSHFSINVQCQDANAQFQIEQFGDRPTIVSEAA